MFALLTAYHAKQGPMSLEIPTTQQAHLSTQQNHACFKKGEARLKAEPNMM
jgi:hypothetical protein